ncbi:hypothetical protein ABIB75_007890 [Bradyrhizobium sp. GM2.2]
MCPITDEPKYVREFTSRVRLSTSVVLGSARRTSSHCPRNEPLKIGDIDSKRAGLKSRMVVPESDVSEGTRY